MYIFSHELLFFQDKILPLYRQSESPPSFKIIMQLANTNSCWIASYIGTLFANYQRFSSGHIQILHCIRLDSIAYSAIASLCVSSHSSVTQQDFRDETRTKNNNIINFFLYES